ncbi:MAG: asparagine synthase (glutamine-hydrolyzing) [Oscillospiraceae bacterium]|nr:asparagine synthase (glutamine-hydrolyzing) [Oscillospiraceae bacterium]
MCAIAGEFNFRRRPDCGIHARGRAMLTTMKRRGPDQDGVRLTENGLLLHARLSVIDPKNGVQPMTYCKDNVEYSVVYNGELYNTAELRRELEALGHTFRTRCDTEVVLKAYLEWKDRCVEKFNGIFAFAVWDSPEKALFLARDRMGVKPLFYALRGESLVFASEIKTLLTHPDIPAEIDRDGIAEIMLNGPGRTPGYGVFKGIEEVRPAHCGYFDRDGLRLKRYWKLLPREHTESFDETAEHVRFLVTDSIRRQLISDVPIGTFLSGGLDSSLISAVACKELSAQGKCLHTFSVDYRDNEKYFRAGKFQPNSDSSFIRKMQEQLSGEHHLVLLDTVQLADALYDAVEARDLPGMADVDASLLLFCKEIKEHVTVALSGECADEIFGGYPWYRDPEIRQKAGFPWAQTTEWRASFLRNEWQTDPAAFMEKRYQATLDDTETLPGTSAEEKRMQEMMRLNLDWFMQTLLDRKDRMSMYNGLEVRVPFCDWRIADYLYSVPWAFKDRQGQEKGLLREAMRGWLPDEVLFRKKSPYPKTHNPAYRREVAFRLRNVMEDPSSPLLSLVKKTALEALLESESAVPWYGQLMTAPQTIAYFLQVDHWLRKYKVRIV